MRVLAQQSLSLAVVALDAATSPAAVVVARPRLGGLHHRYELAA
jgi:hypothetical protein